MKFKNGKESSEKIKLLIEYFDEEKKVNRKDPKYDRAKKLEAMIKIFLSDENEIRKINKMSMLYKKSKDFKRQFSDLQKYSDDEVLSYFVYAINQIGEYFESREGLIERSKELIDIEKKGYFDGYETAKEIITLYINYNKSPFTDEFLKDNGINLFTFNNALSIIFELDDDLYDQYCEVAYEKQMLRQIETIEKVRRIEKGITEGITEDGSKFDAVEFYKNIPFYNSDTAKEILDDFGLKNGSYMDQKLTNLFEKVSPEYKSQIRKYMIEHNLMFGIPEQRRLSETEIMETRYIINNEPLSDEAKKTIIKYMRDNKIPFLQRCFNAVKNKYLSEGLDVKKDVVLKK